ncbi:MAG: hypothetical protein ACK5M4_12570 [Pseudorhodobacter sp.]
MHHAKEAHDVGFHAHAFALPREGRMARIFQAAFPEGYFSDEHQEWRIDWNPAEFPEQGRRIIAFEDKHGVEALHRY